jgi:hypothetical protein
VTVYAVTEIGHMMDFMKAFPSVSREEYLWKWTVPQIRIASADNTHVVYLSEYQIEQRKATHYDGKNIEALSDLGVPIFGINNNK